MKANNHVSAGKTKAQCDAIGPVIKGQTVDTLAYEIDLSLMRAEAK